MVWDGRQLGRIESLSPVPLLMSKPKNACVFCISGSLLDLINVEIRI